MEKKKIVVYVRVGANESVDIPCEYLKRLLDNREECELIDYYCDRGTCGRDRKRLGFNKMIADAKSGKFDYIIVKSMAQLSRDTQLTIKTINELKECGVGVYSVEERLDTLAK